MWKNILLVILFLWLQLIPLLGIIFALIGTNSKSLTFDYLIIMGGGTFFLYLYFVYRYFQAPSKLAFFIPLALVVIQLGLTAVTYLFKD